MRRRVSKRNPNNIGGPNTCKVIETLPTQTIATNTPYLFVKTGITGQRAPEIAKQFGLYRIAKIIFTHKPWYDTFTPGFAAGGGAPAQYQTTVPQLYWKMNRYGDAPVGFTAATCSRLVLNPFVLMIGH